MRRKNIENFEKYLPEKTGKRALLIYLTIPLQQEKDGVGTKQFSNNGAGRSWGKVLNQLGYSVDCMQWDNTWYKPAKKYDLIILHGGYNYQNVITALNKGGKVIYYSTGSYWVYHNKQEQFRFTEFNKRNRTKLKPDRLIVDSEEQANKLSDAIISLGNKDANKTYAKFPKVFGLEGGSYTADVAIKHDFTSARKHILFLAGPGNVHKGLDLLLEALRDLPDIHAHIVCPLDSDFEALYHNDLYKRASIHTYGYVEQRSALFYAILRQCSYVALLSCSEGSPGSVIEGMQHGLVPIVTQESHISTPSFAAPITDLSKLKSHLMALTDISPAVLKSQSKATIGYCNKHFSIVKFEDNLRAIVTKIV